MSVNTMSDGCKEFYSDESDIWGEPQIYKGVKLYPIKIKDRYLLNYMMSILGHCKNNIPDKEILNMSYLKFIVYILEMYVENKDNSFSLFMKYVFKKDIKIICYYKTEHIESQSDFYLKFIIRDVEIGVDENGEILKEDVAFTESDFEIIREIILNQNGITLSYINEYNKELEEKLDFANRKSASLTFKEQIFSLCAYMKQPIDIFKDYTWLQFVTHMDRVGILIDYEIYKPLESSGQVEFKNSKLNHWLEHIPSRGRYDSILIRKESYVNDSDLFKIASNK